MAGNSRVSFVQFQIWRLELNLRWHVLFDSFGKAMCRLSNVRERTAARVHVD